MLVAVGIADCFIEDHIDLLGLASAVEQRPLLADRPQTGQVESAVNVARNENIMAGRAHDPVFARAANEEIISSRAAL